MKKIKKNYVLGYFILEFVSLGFKCKHKQFCVIIIDILKLQTLVCYFIVYFFCLSCCDRRTRKNLTFGNVFFFFIINLSRFFSTSILIGYVPLFYHCDYDYETAVLLDWTTLVKHTDRHTRKQTLAHTHVTHLNAHFAKFAKRRDVFLYITFWFSFLFKINVCL